MAFGLRRTKVLV